MPSGLVTDEDGKSRCWWGASTPDYAAYHDTEWGFGVTSDQRLFEKICLEGFQSGLSWLTILRKRENFRRAFAGFDFEKIARYNSRSVERLLREASRDPKVLAIKMSLYRTSAQSKVVGYLIDAARNGKQVAVVMELKARFDPDNLFGFSFIYIKTRRAFAINPLAKKNLE